MLTTSWYLAPVGTAVNLVGPGFLHKRMAEKFRLRSPGSGSTAFSRSCKLSRNRASSYSPQPSAVAPTMHCRRSPAIPRQRPGLQRCGEALRGRQSRAAFSALREAFGNASLVDGLRKADARRRRWCPRRAVRQQRVVFVGNDAEVRSPFRRRHRKSCRPGWGRRDPDPRSRSRLF